MKMSKTRIVFAAIIAVVLMNLTLWVLLPPALPWQRQVSLSFSGYTNDNSGARLALFTLANQGGVAVCATPFCDRVDRDNKVLEPRPGLTNLAVIGPKKAWMFSVPAPVEQEPWRLSILCNCEGPRSAFSNWVGSFPRLRAVIPHKWRGIPSDFIVSGWISRTTT
jgi:hypothetical protein